MYFKEIFKGVGYICVDTETYGDINSDDIRVHMISICTDKGHKFTVDEFKWNNETKKLERHMLHERVVEFVEALKDHKLVFHNWEFDVRVLELSYGVDLTQNVWIDTIDLVHTCDEHQKDYQLKGLGQRILGREPDAQDKVRASARRNMPKGGKVGDYLYRAEYDIQKEYALEDVVITQGLVEWGLKRLKEDNLEKYFFDHIMKVAKELTGPMNKRGFQLDVPLIKGLLKRAEEYLPQWQRDFEQALRDSSLDLSRFDKNPEAELTNPRTDIFKQMLYDNGLVDANLEFDKKVVEKIRESEEHPWIEYIAFLRAVDKNGTTGLAGFLKRSNSEGIHEGGFMRRTKTGRYNGRLQQMPKFKDEKYDSLPTQLFKDLYKAQRSKIIARRGYKFIVADYTSLEPHIFASLSKCTELIDALNNDKDFYCTIALKVFSEFIEDKAKTLPAEEAEALRNATNDPKDKNCLKYLAKDIRDKVKPISLGIAYGREFPALSKQLGLSFEDTRHLMTKYFRAFPELDDWRNKSIEQALETGYVRVPNSRLRRFDMYTKYKSMWDIGEVQLRRYCKQEGLDYTHIENKMYEVERKMRDMCVNVQCQATAADVVKEAGVLINRRAKELGIDAGVILEIHDELVIECPEEHVDAFAKEVQWCMENGVAHMVPGVRLKAKPYIRDNYLGKNF